MNRLPKIEKKTKQLIKILMRKHEKKNGKTFTLRNGCWMLIRKKSIPKMPKNPRGCWWFVINSWFQECPISPKVSDIVRKQWVGPEIFWHWTNQCSENSVLVFQYKCFTLLSLYFYSLLSLFNLCFVFSLLGFFLESQGGHLPSFYSFLSSFCSLGFLFVMSENCGVSDWGFMVP